jgi:uncharacterized protein YecE (DUF72 family)
MARRLAEGASQIRIGPAGWSYKDWAGIVYPSRKPGGFHEAAFLSEFFDTIEINTSFYQPLRPEHCRNWLELVATNPRFLFTAKLWQKFTHEVDAGGEDERAVRAGFDVLREGGKLGAVLLQFPFSFHRTEESCVYLNNLLKRFSDYPLVVEVRHATWNDKAFYAMLHDRGVGFCNIDQPVIGRSMTPTERTTSRVAYVRLHGRRYDTWFSDDAAPKVVAPATPFNKNIGPHRRWAFGSLPLSEVKAVKNALRKRARSAVREPTRKRPRAALKKATRKRGLFFGRKGIAIQSTSDLVHALHRLVDHKHPLVVALRVGGEEEEAQRGGVEVERGAEHRGQRWHHGLALDFVSGLFFLAAGNRGHRTCSSLPW